MVRKTLRRVAGIAAGVIVLSALSGLNAFARDRGRGHGHGDEHVREVVVVGHDRYHYHDGRFYRPWWFGFEFTVSAPPFGAVVRTLPRGHRIIIVNNESFYCYDNVYYQAYPSGYMVVPEPVVIAAPAATQAAASQASASGTVTINIPRAQGGYTPVTLIRQNDGYIGPQGEYYQGAPTVEQLKVLYGK